MSIMKTKMLYAIVAIVILAVAIIGWYYFNSVGQYVGTKCPKWKCTDTKAYTCTNVTTNYTCSNGVLSCYICSTNYTTKIYNVTLTAIGYQNTTNGTALAGVFTINGESLMIRAGQTKTLLDMTIFGVTTLYLNYSAFYLQSPYETKSSSLAAPFPKSTTVNLIVSQSQGCGAVTNSCPSGYTPSCSGSTLTCTGSTNFICSVGRPFSGCTQTGSCNTCIV